MAVRKKTDQDQPADIGELMGTLLSECSPLDVIEHAKSEMQRVSNEIASTHNRIKQLEAEFADWAAIAGSESPKARKAKRT